MAREFVSTMFRFLESGEIVIIKLSQLRQRININIRQSLLRMVNRLSIFTSTYYTHLVHLIRRWLCRSRETRNDRLYRHYFASFVIQGKNLKYWKLNERKWQIFRDERARRSYFTKVTSYFTRMFLYRIARVEPEIEKSACIYYWFPIFSQTYSAYISMSWKWNSRRHSARAWKRMGG